MSYGKIEWSDPRFETGGLRFLTFNSPALGGRGDVAFFIPGQAETDKPLPLVLLLHGVYCSHWAWAFKGGAHLTAARLIQAGEIPPMVLAMPSDGLWGEGSGYLRHEHADYEAWIADDVVGCALQTVACLGEDSPVFIAGLSMGGYASMRLGSKYPERFNGISAHSSITRGGLLPEFIQRRPLNIAVTADEELDITYWMEKNRSQLPPIRFDCGLEDRLLEENRELHRQLQAMGIRHQYQEFPGAHKWPYWAEHLQDSLKFFGEIASS